MNNAHKNARTTPHIRELMVRRVLAEGASAKAVATALALSERTVRKWLARYRAEGKAGLANRSSRPTPKPCSFKPNSAPLAEGRRVAVFHVKQGGPRGAPTRATQDTPVREANAREAGAARGGVSRDGSDILPASGLQARGEARRSHHPAVEIRPIDRVS